MAGWHYHAVLECGHKVAFDLKQNLMLQAVVEDGAPDALVNIPCRECGGEERVSTDLKVTMGMGRCSRCS